MDADHPERKRRFPSSDGELAQLIAAYDWQSTSLGPSESWPASLRSTVDVILRSHVPIVTLWGEDGVMIYNDAYSRFAAGRHPKLLGSKVREGWPEVASFNDHVMKVCLGGGTLSYKDQELTLHRNDVPEQVWMDLDYSPVADDEGRPVGVIAIVLESTQKVLAERLQKSEQERLRVASRALAESENRLRRAQEAGGVGVFTIELDEDLLRGTPQFCRIFGVPEVDVMPAAALQRLIVPEDEHLATNAARRQSGEMALEVEYRIRRANDQALRIIARRAEFEYDDAKRPIRLAGVVQDVTEQRAFMRAIEESEQQFRTFAQAMPNQVWAAPPDGMLDWANERVYEYSGMRPGELYGADWARIIHPDDRELTWQRWTAALRTGDVYENEFRVRRADGVYRWHLARAVALRASDGSITRWIGTNTDIHEQKLAEAENARDRDRMWTMSRDLMLVCDFDGLITAVNPTVDRLLGWTQEEVVGRSVAEFVHPADLAATAAEVAKLSTGTSSPSFQNRFVTKDGDYRLLEWTGVPDAGRIHAVGRDITEVRAIARDQERIWTVSPVLKVVASSAGVIAKINPAWTQSLGWSEPETTGRNLSEFVEPGDAELLVRLRTQRPSKAIQQGEVATLARDGSKRRIAWSFVVENQTVYGFGQDVTEQRSTEDALRQSQKMEAVGQLTGGIAHDFNNLLQGIAGSLDLLQKRMSQGRFNEIDRFVQGAMASTNRAAALTHRLLAFSRRQPLDPRPVRANALIASMEDLLRRTLGEGIGLEMVLSAGLWVTRCDPNQLESAILNLAINARDAMPHGGKLVIETGNAHLDSAYTASQSDVRPGQYICVNVTDTGTGMDATVAARAFEPFFTTKPIGQGTGLGLSMVYGFARQSEGAAKIYSEVGHGTTFKLYLPRFRGDADADQPVPQLSDRHATDTGEVVLVVEDEAVVRDLITTVLKDLGYFTIEASDGPEGLRILQSDTRIDLLITDIGLPGLNGRQIADAGRSIRPGLKILFMTGYAENAALASGFLEPGMSMITKPFAMEGLATRVRTIIKEA